MPLDTELQTLIDNLPAGIALPAGDPLEARKMFHDLTVAVGQAQPPADLASTEDVTVPGAAGDLAARIYRPHADGPTTTMLYIHGGGFVVGDIDAYDLTARTIAEKTGVTVISTDYRLVPEDPWPASPDDAVSVARWVLANVDSLGGDPSCVLVAGDSAGGNLAAVVAQQLRGESPGFSGQVLLYPVTDFASEDYASFEEHAGGPVLTEDAARMFHELYAGDVADHADPRLSPLRGDLAGLPPAVLVTAEYDVLRDQGIAYRDALEAAGVPVVYRHYNELPHGFFGFGPFSAGVRSAIDEVCAAAVDLMADPV
jgi:acetyl esterase